MRTNLQKIADEMVSEIENFAKNIKDTDSYQYENGMFEILNRANHQLMQASIGKLPQGINSKISVKTRFGKITVPKSHPMSSCPMGFHISPSLQEHICRLGSKLVFAEASEEISGLLGLDISDKQIERLCHCYGEKLEEVDWENAYSDSIQMKIKHQVNEPVYAMVDGGMLLTREESWKEMKLGRLFCESSMAQISKNRGLLTDSVYTAHLGNASDFWEKFSAEIPACRQLVFICDGAKWIWNYIDDCYPESTQILDFYHCKEHICQFSNHYYGDKETARAFSESTCGLLLSGEVEKALGKIGKLKFISKKKETEKEKLLQYLTNNKKRINYGYFQEKGLLIGSGAIEAAHKDVIQKRMKLSGQRWTIDGAQQIANLRVVYKSNRWNRVVNCIKNIKDRYKKVA